MQRRGFWRLGLVLLALITLLLPVGGCRNADLSRDIDQIAAPYRFSIAAWEVQRLPAQIAAWIQPDAVADSDASAVVVRYFTLGRNQRLAEFNHSDDLDAITAERQALAPAAAQALARQISSVLAELGLAGDDNAPWPPVSFVLETPPTLLIVSPRDRIEILDTINLKPDISVEERAEIEKQADALGYVSLVDDLGGIGATYPAFVSERGTLEWAVSTAVEEWLHQYLFFRPLGWRYATYLLDLGGEPDIATVNETFVGIVSDEIAEIIMQRYYPAYISGDAELDPDAFDFNAAMRETRLTVDALLARGEVAEAEAYMAQRRDYIEANGYYIRKLNQAYFAFHGRYAAAPTSVDPLGDELRAYRAQFDDLSAFVAAVAAVRSRAELEQLMAAQ